MCLLPSEFLVVGIGASAGGIEALQQFFANVPANSGCAYVVILHLSPDYKSRLAAILQTVANVPVRQVTERLRILPDHVYVVPPNQHLTLVDGELQVTPNTLSEERRAPLDLFFRSLAESHEGRAVCVILSGTGADGSLGLKRIKELGGAAFVQSPSEAAFADMPQNAIATKLVDAVLPVAAIPARIAAYFAGLGHITIAVETEQRPDDQQQALREVFAQLRLHTGHDFASYKRPTILRRIERRISACALPDLPTYALFLRDHPDEVQALLKNLLISVTNFFRDQAAFATLAQDVLPRIITSRKLGEQVRIWVVGCATGEEAYSIAMLIAELTADLLDAPSIQIFATDIDDAAIAHAREALYSVNDTVDLTPEQLRQFFVREDNSYRVRNELREQVLFANHNILKDPPFSRIDLIACRNLLIYLNHTAQERVLETLHFALNPDGYLFIGNSEAIDSAGDLFSTLSREHHLFQRRAVASRPPPLPVPIPLIRFNPQPALPRSPVDDDQDRAPLSFGVLHQRLLEQYAPPSVVINQDYTVLHLSERVGRYLQIGGGELSTNLLVLVRPELRLDLRTALHQAKQYQRNVDAGPIGVLINDQPELVLLRVRPVLQSDEVSRGLLLVLFETEVASLRDVEPVTRVDEPVSRQLEHEILYLEQQLRRSTEQYEFQSEELKASNEELQALNEELRSSTEELETSKEELQSINEELRTVNQELKVKVEEATLYSTNLQNLVNSAEVGTIFLDRNLRVKLFTPTARALFNLIPADHDRQLADITHRLIDVDVLADALAVLSSLQTIEREVTTDDERVFMLRVLPYRTAEDRIDGIVLTFFDITARKAVEAQVRASLAAEQAARLAAETTSTRLAGLQTITAALASAATYEAIYTAITQYSAIITGATTVAVAMLDPTEAHVRLVSWTGHSAEELAAMVPLALSEPLPMAVAINERIPLWLATPDEAEVRLPGLRALMERAGFQSIATFPLLVDQHALGAICFGYALPQRFGAEDGSLIETLAQQCAQALERTRLNRELQESQTRLQFLSQQLLKTQEQERRHLARELHDEVGQALTGLRLELELFSRSLPEGHADQLANAHHMTQQLIEQIQTLSLDLRPAMLDDQGLLPAVLWLISRYRKQTGISVELRHRGLDQRLLSEHETVAYRVVQEALTNIARHAKVVQATVALLFTPPQLLVQIRDEGCGFVLEDALAGGRSSGLLGMQERVALLGGTLNVETAPGKGTTILADLPLHGMEARLDDNAPAS
ncbi:MAG: CheR family methyltransferase [Oscillochloridaceae bacterium umkhey_bin13]